MNNRGVLSARGGLWHVSTVRNLLARTGLPLLVVLLCLPQEFDAQAFRGAELFQLDTRIAHAGGGYRARYDYTNSTVALDESYAKGFRLFELDLQATRDGGIVCIHSWRDLRWLRASPLTMREFLKWRSGRVAEPCTMDELATWFLAHPDAILITDTKSESIELLREIAAALGAAAGRLVVQVYSPEMLEVAYKAGFERIIYGVYVLPRRLRSIEHLGRLRGHPALLAVNLPKDDVLNGTLAHFAALDRPILVHTVNDCAELEQLAGLGVAGIFTDFLHPGACL